MGKYENGTLTLRMNDILKCALPLQQGTQFLWDTQYKCIAETSECKECKALQHFLELISQSEAFGVAGNWVIRGLRVILLSSLECSS